MNTLQTIASDYLNVKPFYNSISQFLDDMEINYNRKEIILYIEEIEKERIKQEKVLELLIESSIALKMISKDNKRNYIIYSNSAKEENKKQLTFFINNIPYSDMIRDNEKEIIRELKYYMDQYYISEYIGKEAI